MAARGLRNRTLLGQARGETDRLMHEKAHRYQRVQKMDALSGHMNRIDRHDHDAIKRAKYAKSGVSGRQAAKSYTRLDARIRAGRERAGAIETAAKFYQGGMTLPPVDAPDRELVRLDPDLFTRTMKRRGVEGFALTLTWRGPAPVCRPEGGGGP